MDVEVAFELETPPHLATIAPFRFAHVRARGPYVPWTRLTAVDEVALALERAGVARTGPAFGLYHDLPYSSRPVEAWVADLGWPVPNEAPVPGPLRVTDVPAVKAAGLRYRGNVQSFPGALQLLVEWLAAKDVAPRGPLLQRFHVSDAMTGREERDVWIALEPVPI